MAEYNGVRIEPLSDGGQDLNYQVEQFIFWGAGRAAVLALSPKFSNVALCTNATYMVTRIAHLYDVELQTGACRFSRWLEHCYCYSCYFLTRTF